VTDWTEDEVTDAGRDVAAMLRAQLDSRHDDIDAILDGAGDRGTRAIAATFLGMAADLLVRLTVAVSVIEDPQMLQAVTGTDTADLMAQPDIRQAVEENVAPGSGRHHRGRLTGSASTRRAPAARRIRRRMGWPGGVAGKTALPAITRLRSCGNACPGCRDIGCFSATGPGISVVPASG